MTTAATSFPIKLTHARDVANELTEAEKEVLNQAKFLSRDLDEGLYTDNLIWLQYQPGHGVGPVARFMAVQKFLHMGILAQTHAERPEVMVTPWGKKISQYT